MYGQLCPPATVPETHYQLFNDYFSQNNSSVSLDDLYEKSPDANQVYLLKVGEFLDLKNEVLNFACSSF